MTLNPNNRPDCPAHGSRCFGCAACCPPNPLEDGPPEDHVADFHTEAEQSAYLCGYADAKQETHEELRAWVGSGLGTLQQETRVPELTISVLADVARATLARQDEGWSYPECPPADWLAGLLEELGNVATEVLDPSSRGVVNHHRTQLYENLERVASLVAVWMAACRIARPEIIDAGEVLGLGGPDG